jgi:hypothetical protein
MFNQICPAENQAYLYKLELHFKNKRHDGISGRLSYLLCLHLPIKSENRFVHRVTNNLKFDYNTESLNRFVYRQI